MPQSFNVVINSNFCTTETAGNATNDKNYYIDWTSILPQGEYQLSFSFIAEGNQLTTLPTVPLIYIDFLTQGKIDAVQPSYQATSSNFLGMVYPIVFHNATNYNYFRADIQSNNPIYLSNRPYTNNFRVQILTNDNPPVPYVDQTAAPVSIAPYVLNLHFKLLKEAK